MFVTSKMRVCMAWILSVFQGHTERSLLQPDLPPTFVLVGCLIPGITYSGGKDGAGGRARRGTIHSPPRKTDLHISFYLPRSLSARYIKGLTKKCSSCVHKWNAHLMSVLASSSFPQQMPRQGWIMPLWQISTIPMATWSNLKTVALILNCFCWKSDD